VTAIRRRYVDAPGGQIHVHEVAGSATPIVFLHQTALSAKTYDPLLGALDVPNRLIALDTPGFGGSYDPAGSPTLDWYADEIGAALDALGVTRCHLYGHHTGACLAIEIAARRPEHVASLTLSGPVFMTETERAAFVEGYRNPIVPVRDGSHLLRNWAYAADHNPTCSVEALQQAVVDLLRAWRGRPQAYMAVAHHDTAGRAADVRAPVLLMTTPGDFFHMAFDRAVALFPDADTATTSGDNFPTVAAAGEVAGAITHFLAGVPG
jgi:pimeloyl-ACP methyl ester carboxylesterase